MSWGIGDLRFVAGYGLLALTVLLKIVVARRRLAAGAAGRAASLGEQPYDIAYLFDAAEAR